MKGQGSSEVTLLTEALLLTVFTLCRERLKEDENEKEITLANRSEPDLNLEYSGRLRHAPVDSF